MLFDLPQEERPIIKVIGVGGGGSNAVTHMFSQGIVGVDFAIGNTDKQAMAMSPVPTCIELGPELTEGRGAGSRPQIGKQACIESIDDVRAFLDSNTKMLFVTAGMGGGTGTGAAPIIAKAAKEMDILTVGIVTLPFNFEGRRRTRHALEGLEELKECVDAIVVISNDKLREIHGDLSMSEAFAKADDILTTAAKGIAEIITVGGHVNVDFEDVNTVMRDSGVAIMGTASFEGENRAQRAVVDALNSPLLEDNDIRGAQHILLNISSGSDEVTMDEISTITEYVQGEAGYGTDLIWGHCKDETLGESLTVTIIATGFEHRERAEAEEVPNVKRVPLEPKDETIEEMFSTNVSSPENETTFEFPDVRPVAESGKGYSYKEPYVKSEEKERIERAQKSRAKREESRREKMRTYTYMNPTKLNSTETIADLTNEPAFRRRKVELDDVPHSSDVELSRWTLSDDEEPQLREGNSYLHDNVD
jgi:cell division protein FtsZ